VIFFVDFRSRNVILSGHSREDLANVDHSPKTRRLFCQVQAALNHRLRSSSGSIARRCPGRSGENMGREVRRVPANWHHPKDSTGNYIPMHEHFTYEPEEVAEGLRGGWLQGDPPHYGVPVMPDWPESERTHYQMYEDCSEGTPISPVKSSPEELAHWLADNRASAFGNMTATYEQWLRVCLGGSAPSMIVTNGQIKSGVAGADDIAKAKGGR
jgi:hypothetical protein